MQHAHLGSTQALSDQIKLEEESNRLFILKNCLRIICEVPIFFCLKKINTDFIHVHNIIVVLL